MGHAEKVMMVVVMTVGLVLVAKSVEEICSYNNN